MSSSLEGVDSAPVAASIVEDLISLADDNRQDDSTPQQSSSSSYLSKTQLDILREATGLDDIEFDAIKEEEEEEGEREDLLDADDDDDDDEDEEPKEVDTTIEKIEQDLDEAWLSSSLQFSDLGTYDNNDKSICTYCVPCRYYTSSKYTFQGL